MHYNADIAPIATLLADPARAAMVGILLDGRALPAGELARAAGVSAQTASSHLAKLTSGGLLRVHAQGRHRYYGIASAEIAHAIETLSTIAPLPQVRSLTQSLEAKRLSSARSCYDHLAGALAVGIADSLVSQGHCMRHEGGFAVTASGIAFFSQFGIVAPEFTKTCIDWTQRRPHIGGSLGKSFFTHLVESGWIERGDRRRSIEVTDAGREALRKYFGSDVL